MSKQIRWGYISMLRDNNGKLPSNMSWILDLLDYLKQNKQQGKR